tara:strand:- start:5584 stop:5928 length:345 start_codon:yes stop_codon:yes gene_type:complete
MESAEKESQMLTALQTQLFNNLITTNYGEMFDYVSEDCCEPITGLVGWVHVKDLVKGSIESVQTAKSVLGSMAAEGYVTIFEEDGQNGFQFTAKLAAETGMTQGEARNLWKGKA